MKSREVIKNMGRESSCMAAGRRVMEKITSKDIKLALSRKHGNREFFITECKNGPTGVARGQLLLFDAIAIYKSWSRPQIRGYEIKVSRSDFLRDAKYAQYIPYCHEFYFVTPTGLVQRQEVEENIGLIWYNPKTGALTTKKKAVYRDIEVNADMLLYIIMNRLDSDRQPFYSEKTEYWEDWLKNKISNRQLGYRVKSKLLEQLRELEDENKRYINYKDALQELRDIREVLHKHKIHTWGDTANKLDEALSLPFPKELDNIRETLSNVILEIDQYKDRMQKPNEETEVS